jgi:hypothetical protein
MLSIPHPIQLASSLGRRQDNGATLDDLCEAVHMLEDSERTARRVIGGAHPVVVWIEEVLQNARAALRAREEPSGA